jgi:MFS family permease
MSQIPENPQRRALQVGLTDAEWEEIQKRQAARESELRAYSGRLRISVEGSTRVYDAGDTISLDPDRGGAGVSVTDEEGRLVAAFFLPETDPFPNEEGSEAQGTEVHPGPPLLMVSTSGNTAKVHREITTSDLAIFDEANWLRCHWIVASLLAATWMIIGAQVTMVEAIHGSFNVPDYIAMVNAYLLGTIPGAIVFGWLADRFGRKKLYTMSAFIYILTASAMAWFSPDHFIVLWVFRFLVGFAAGGEYVALTTTLQELMPKRRRGWACITINGTFWLGSLTVYGVSLAWPGNNWRTVCLVVGALGLVLLFLRCFLPESPRWLIAHYRQGRDRWTRWMLDEIRLDLEKRSIGLKADVHRVLVPAWIPPGWLPLRLLWNEYRTQTLMCLALVCAQAFFYNSFYFRYSLVTEAIYTNGMVAQLPPYLPFIIPAFNFLGPLILAYFFDKWRKWMTSAMYITSGVLLLGIAVSIWRNGVPLEPLGMTLALGLVFFFASAAASSSYLVLGESFPVEVRASAFAILFGIGMSVGIVGSILYDVPYHICVWFTGAERAHIATLGIFCFVSALAMIGAARVQQLLGREAAGRSLEELAPSLSRVGGWEGRTPARV